MSSERYDCDDPECPCEANGGMARHLRYGVTYKPLPKVERAARSADVDHTAAKAAHNDMYNSIAYDRIDPKPRGID